MANPNYDWKKTALKSLVGLIVPLIPTIAEEGIKVLKDPKSHVPVIVVAVSVGAIRGFLNWLKNR